MAEVLTRPQASTRPNQEYRTKTGKLITDAMIEDWAAEAERGYDVVSEIHLVVQGNVLGIIDIISAHEDRAEGRWRKLTRCRYKSCIAP